jgi:DnaJ-class molecular chaperone
MNSFVVTRPCAFCRGHGRIGTPVPFKPNSNLCPVCRGRGTNEFVENIRLCTACGGNGTAKGADRPSRCPSCSGTGWIPYTTTPPHRR